MDLASACIFVLYSYIILIVAIVCKGSVVFLSMQFSFQLQL